jgi:putative FmdB family regulatory protein
MPIYAYKCDSCGFAKDVLQKISDAPLQDCPTCGQPSFKKQLTAAGFQLKGSGWYVTDFKGGNAPATATTPATPASGESSPAPAAKADAASPVAAAPVAASTSAPPAAETK